MLLSRAGQMFKTSVPFAATRKVYFMNLLAFSIAVAIAATLWAAIRTKDTMFSIPLLIFLVLLSVAEGALGELFLWTHSGTHTDRTSLRNLESPDQKARRLQATALASTIYALSYTMPHHES
jgi:alkylation response protein AidB-like acyl-CoA dehydrogenase